MWMAVACFFVGVLIGHLVDRWAYQRGVAHGKLLAECVDCGDRLRGPFICHKCALDKNGQSKLTIDGLIERDV